MNFVACSVRHKSCSRYHADLVRGYNQERERQEAARAEETGMYCAEESRWDEDHRLITFKQWLKANRRTDRT